MSCENEWKTHSITEIVEVIGGGTPKTSIPEYWNGEIPWLSVTDFNNDNRLVRSTEKTITEEGLNNSSTKILKKGQLIISARGTVGALGQLGKNMAFNQSCYGLNAKDGFDNDFLYYLLKYDIESIKRQSHGSVFDTITRDTFKQMFAKIPCLSEQQKIASILKSIDDKIELLHETNETLEQIAQALFKHWFIDFEFPDENGNPYRSSGGAMKPSPMGLIPEGWDVISIDKTANFLNGLALQKYPPTNDNYLPVIKIRELKQGLSDTTDKASDTIPPEYIVNNGDLLFSWSGSLECCLWCNGKGALNQHLFKVTSDSYPKWFNYYWILQYLTRYQKIASDKATTMGHIQRKHLSDSLVLVPSIQTLVIMDQKMTPIIDNIVQYKIHSQSLTELRDLLLPRLMSGKIRVPTKEGDN